MKTALPASFNHFINKIIILHYHFFGVNEKIVFFLFIW